MVFGAAHTSLVLTLGHWTPGRGILSAPTGAQSDTIRQRDYILPRQGRDRALLSLEMDWTRVFHCETHVGLWPAKCYN